MSKSSQEYSGEVKEKGKRKKKTRRNLEKLNMEEHKEDYTRDQSNSTDLVEDKAADTPNKKPKAGTFYNSQKPNLTKENSDIFEPAFGDFEPDGGRRINSIVKLVNARDPPNKFFESTVNLANQDAWQRRSIYMSKASMNFEPPYSQNIRNTMHSGLSKNELHKEDSWDDDYFNNTDEGIGEHDRVIPVIGAPKCLTALMDKTLPVGLQKLLKQSTRFSHSFHVSRDSLRNSRDSSIQGLSKQKIGKRHRKDKEEEAKTGQTQDASPTNNFFGYKNFTEVQNCDSKEFEDNCNFDDETWVKEKTLHQHKDSLNQFIRDSAVSKNKFYEEEKDQNEAIEPLNHSKEHQSYIDKIEEIDNKKRAISEVEVKPKKNLNSMVSKVQSPFSIVNDAPTSQLNRNSDGEYGRKSKGSSGPNKDRESVDLWRASDDLDKNKKEEQMTEPEPDKDKLLDEWLHRGRGDNNTIAEDVDAENAEESNRMSGSSRHTNSSYRPSNAGNQEEEDDEENELHKIHMLQSLQALQYMKKVPIPPIEDLQHMAVFLPKPKSKHLKKTLIFDMDETLIHCVDDIEEENPQVVLDVVFEDGEVVDAGINVRPYAIECLKAANELFQVIVFTASHKCYADVVLDHIDPTGELIQYRLYRDSCYKTEDNVYIKDLRIIQNREMCDLVIVDNAVYSFGFQLDNGIPIIPYYEDPNDEELFHLIPYLEILAEGDDVRVKNREAFQLREMAKENTEELEYFNK